MPIPARRRVARHPDQKRVSSPAGAAAHTMPAVRFGALAPADLLHLQRTAGNSAVQQLLLDSNRAGVQRQPETRQLAPRTHAWPSEEALLGPTRMRRTTTVEATGWAEVGPAPPRVNYHREVDLTTEDGIHVYLDIRETAMLAPDAPVPETPEAALGAVGRRVRSQLTVRIDGGDIVPVDTFDRQDVLGLSLSDTARSVLPDYADLPLTAPQQEDLILKHLAALPRLPKDADEPGPEPDEDPGALRMAIGLVTDFIPVIGELKDAYRALAGVDPDTGRKLRWWERLLSGVLALPLFGTLLRGLSKGAKVLGKGFRWLGRRGKAVLVWVIDTLRGARKGRAAKVLRAAIPTLEDIKKLTPRGWTFQQWAVTIFGHGPKEAVDLIGKRSARELEAIGLTVEKAEVYRDFYKAAAAGGRGGTTAESRIQLLEHIITVLGG